MLVFLFCCLFYCNETISLLCLAIVVAWAETLVGRRVLGTIIRWQDSRKHFGFLSQGSDEYQIPLAC